MAWKNQPMSGFSAAPPETKALRRPPKRWRTLLRTRRSSTQSLTRSHGVRRWPSLWRFRPSLSVSAKSFCCSGFCLAKPSRMRVWIVS